MGYHKIKIPKGVYREGSKIVEEYHEWRDAVEQSNPIMELLELSDLIGAIEAYTEEQYGINLDELVKMMRATKSAFTDGERTTQD